MFMKGPHGLSKDARSILLIQLGDIGDVVLSLPAVRALRENFPRARLVVAVREKAAELIEDCPWADGVISIDQRPRRWYGEPAFQIDFFSQVRANRFDLAVDLRTDSRGAILALLSGARQRAGFYAVDGKLWRNRCYTHLSYLEGRPGQHMAAYYLRLLTTYGVETEHIWPEIVVPRERLERATALLEREDVRSERAPIAVQPFSLWPYKEWGSKNYIELIGRIRREHDLPVIVTGSPGESRRALEIARSCGPGVHSFAGKTSIGMFAAVVKLCGLFVGGDSAGIHISAAVDTPTVSIFGPMSADAWAPRGPRHLTVQKKLSCVPCNQKGCGGSGVSRCLEELSVEDVLEAVNRQLGSKNGFARRPCGNQRRGV